MFPLTRKTILLSILGMVIFGILGFTVLITPDNPLTKFFSAEIAISDAKVVIGPYPNERDFRILEKNKITTIISLLDPRLPYELVLLKREREVAKKYNIEVLNFPMASIFGQPLGDDYDQRAVNAVEAVVKTQGKVYMHCYLGMHRGKKVEDLLRVKGIITGQYLVRLGERDTDVLLLDRAEDEFKNGNYQVVLDLLKQMRQTGQAAQLLQAWATYHLGDTENARNIFALLLRAAPNDNDARTGLGYCAMRDNDLANAEQHFKTVLQSSPNDPASLAGMGLLCYRQGRLKEAAHFLQAAIKIDPRNDEVRKILAELTPQPK